MRKEDNIAIVTGGSRGIGEAIVRLLLEKGFLVVTTSKNGTVPYTHKKLIVKPLDLNDTESISKFKDSISSIDKISLLINSAGIVIERGEDKIIENKLRETINTNLIGTILLTDSIMGLIKTDGLIINISSEFGALSDDWGFQVPAYRISKAGLNMYTRNLYKHSDILTKNIKVISFDPGWVKTDMGGRNAPRSPIEVAKELHHLFNIRERLISGKFYKGNKERAW